MTEDEQSIPFKTGQGRDLDDRALSLSDEIGDCRRNGILPKSAVEAGQERCAGDEHKESDNGQPASSSFFRHR